MSSSIVLIGPSGAIPTLRERLDSGANLVSFTDAQAVEALEHILTHRPTLIALDQEFSVTSRGAALVDRIKNDPLLAACEVRVMAHDGALSRVAVRRGPSGDDIVVAVDEPAATLDPRGTRRAPRIRIRDGVEVLVDGNTASLLDLSRIGALVLSTRMLKPNQRVRLAFFDGKATIRCDGSIVWAAFEMPKGQPPRYRAGIELTAVDADALSAFAERHKRT